MNENNLPVAVVPFTLCGDAERVKQPEGTQNFLVGMRGVSVVLYFDQPVGWLSVDDEVRVLDECCTRLELFGSRWLRLAVCGLSNVQIFQSPVEVNAKGLCYLKAVAAFKRRVVYERFGHFPKLAELCVSGVITRPVSTVSYGHTVHIEGVKGSEDLSKVQADGSAVVGGLTSGHVRNEYDRLKSVLAAKSVDTIWTHVSQVTSGFGAVELDSSQVLSIPVVDTRVNGEWAADVSLSTSYLMSAVMLPVGYRMVKNGVTYGGRDTRVVATFRGNIDFRILPRVGVFTRGDSAVDITYISSKDTNLESHFRKVIDVKSTLARFIRATTSSVLIRVPFDDRDVDQIYIKPKVVMVTDPLENWNALEVRRHEYSWPKLTSVALLSLDVITTLSNFRASLYVDLRIGNYIQLSLNAKPLALLGSYSLTLNKQDGQECESTTSVAEYDCENLQWSVRLTECVDEYCMDRCGPSDSDYSDAL